MAARALRAAAVGGALAFAVGGCATRGIAAPPEGFDPGVGCYLPSDPLGRSPEYAFVSSDAASGLIDELTIHYDVPVSGEFRVAVVELDFYPTAIHGSGPEQLYLAGLQDGRVVVKAQSFALGETLGVGVARTLLATDELATITCLDYVPVEGTAGRLVLLDAPNAELWTLDLATSALALLAAGTDRPELLGMKSFFTASEEGSRDLHYLLFEHFPFETSIGGADRIARLVDVGGDFTIDTAVSMSGAEYVSGDERDAPAR